MRQQGRHGFGCKCAMWGDVGRCGEMVGGVGRREETWGDAGRLHACCTTVVIPLFRSARPFARARFHAALTCVCGEASRASAER